MGAHSTDFTPPLTGLRVVEVYPTMPTAMATQFLADGGAEVLMVEAPGGSSLRQRSGWPVLARGKQSVELDLGTEAGRIALLELLATADIVVESSRPDRSRSGMTKSALQQRFPLLVAAFVSGWGSSGPWQDLKGYEGLVMAKSGHMFAARRMQNPPAPSFISVPYASYGAAQGLIQGVLAALLEREDSGRGQIVETNLVLGALATDTWSWFGELVYLRWPEAYTAIDAWGEDGEPRSPMLFALLAAPTKDGQWLQFAQVSPRLFAAMLEELGVASMLDDPKWQGFPNLESADLRREFWGILISAVRERTLAEWQQVFADRPEISAEIFRVGPDVLQHPQLVHDGRTLTVHTDTYGPVTQPSTLVHQDGAPLLTPSGPPALGEHTTWGAVARAHDPVRPVSEPSSTAPLDGVTIVEFGEMFASPYGSSLLADLGARVIKVESIAGDQIRNLLPFPEAAGAKAMQGKESVQVDLHTEAGRAIAHRLVAKADIVVQSFRAGATERLGIDEPTLRAINPTLIYLNAPGYGTAGPSAACPAYAPSIGAAAGLALTNVPDALGATGTMREIMAVAPRLTTGTACPELQGDGLAAFGVASAMLLGLVARRRHGTECHFTTTMLASMTHVLVDWVADYADRPVSPRVDPRNNGLHALYRQYETADGHVFLAAPNAHDWVRLTRALVDYVALEGDLRFASADARRENQDELLLTLAATFAKEDAEHWEEFLTGHGVGCVKVCTENPFRQLLTDERLVQQYATPANSPIFDDHPRLAPIVSFSRSSTDARGGCLAGQHTSAVLREFGYSDDELTAMHAECTIAGT